MVEYDLGVVEEGVREQGRKLDVVFEMMSRRIVGQKNVLMRLLMAVIADGHVLLEGLPGLAKTTAIKTLSDISKDLSFSRVQFTPDLLPADVIGTQIYDVKSGDFKIKRGPVFANLVLADEINRAPAKVQSALLQAMQEREITIGDQTFVLDNPFLVLATQNPIEQEGTYPLPEAQVDRFLFKVKVGYCSIEEEQEIMRKVVGSEKETLDKIISIEDIKAMRLVASRVHVAEKVRKYIVDIVFSTRDPNSYGLKDIASFISYGVSPRGSIYLEHAAKVNAMMNGRAFVVPQDVKDVGLDVLRHRIIPTYEAEAENISSDEIVRRVFDRVDVP